ncbi:Protein CBG06651 [Caenorhabditis briggsae]|uniref:Protein CBG06651 n=1 Tax=Caenorhabditis briggsae TaxID=6238 RepID=A8X2R9_CAEBR|nr:Protein CBG06651 [Caenorhabditis briggsae]CAP26929.1 Protein CBG06651 [Caenorhabditis briggsae]
MENSTSNALNLHKFAVIENSDRSLQQPLMQCINIFSTCINFILFYLILSDRPKRESKLYRIILLTQTMSLWLSQVHWGSLHGLVFIFPFPGLYGIGYLASYTSSYVLVFGNVLWESVKSQIQSRFYEFQIIWIFLFGITVLTIFLVSIVRLRAIARHNSIFHFNDKFYYIFTFTLSLYILVPMPFCWISSGSTPIETQNFVKTYYPNTLKVLDILGVFIYTDAWKFRRIIIVAVGLISTAGCLYVFLCQAILYEIRQQCRTLSSTVLKYHRKALKDTIVQIVILGIFLGTTPCLQILNAYRDPEADTITATIVINAIFVSSPIPYAITIIYQNTTYRRYIISMLHFRDKPKIPKVGSTIQISIVPGNNSPRSPHSKNRQ